MRAETKAERKANEANSQLVSFVNQPVGFGSFLPMRGFGSPEVSPTTVESHSAFFRGDKHVVGHSCNASVEAANVFAVESALTVVTVSSSL